MLKVVSTIDSKHFRDRLFQRYGILLTASEMWDLRDQLRFAKVLERQDQQTTYIMKIQKKAVRVVVNNFTKRFITAKPLSDNLFMRIY